MSICSSTPQNRGHTNSRLVEGDVKVTKCHAMLFLKTLNEPKMDVILTISFKITAEIETTKHMLCVLLQTRTCIGAVFLPFIHCHGMLLHCFFFIVNSSVNAAGSSLKGVCWRKFHGKGIKLKIFRQCYVFRFCAVVIRYSRVEPKVPGLSPTQYLIFFSVFLFSPDFCVLVFYKYIPK